MSDYAVKKIDEMEAVYLGAFKRARAELGVESFGMQVIDLPPNYEHYPEHDHSHDDQEEVFLVLRGGGEIEIERRALPARRRPRRPGRPGDEAQVWPGPRGSVLVTSAASPARSTRRRTIQPARGDRTRWRASWWSGPLRRPARRRARGRVALGHGKPRVAGEPRVRERSQSEKTEPRVLGTRRWCRQRSQRPAGGRALTAGSRGRGRAGPSAASAGRSSQSGPARRKTSRYSVR